MLAPSSTSLQLMDIAELRRIRRVLRHEVAQASHWRRIVQARLDLTVARTVLPQPLGLDVTDQLGEDAVAALVPHADLVSLARRRGDMFPTSELHRLRAAERSLVEYEAHVRRALMSTTDALVERLCRSGAVP